MTFGVSASSFAANMAMRQNAIDLAHDYPLAAKVVEEMFYVHDYLTGADSLEDVIKIAEGAPAIICPWGFFVKKVEL